ncbi:MAG: exosortase A [Burkholderiales bacterium]
MKTETYFAPDDTQVAHRAGFALGIAVAAAIGAILALYGQSAWSMVEVWRRSDTFAHGFLVVPLALWLVWRKRHLIPWSEARPFWPALGALAVAGFAWLLADLASVVGAGQFALVLMIQAAVVTLLGLRVAGQLAFPLAFLLFAVPIGEFLQPWLIERTADFTVAALQLTGVPVYREGNSFMIPTGSWSVVEACSGVRYLIASLVVGTIYAYVQYTSTKRRLAFIAASIAVPIVANWLRAYMIVMLGHLSGNRIAVGVDHLVYGWVFFGLVMLLLFWVGSFWREDKPRPAPKRSLTLPAITPGGAHRRATAALVVAVAAVVATAGVWRLADAAIESRISTMVPVLAPIASGGGWVSAAQPPSRWVPGFVAPSAELRQAFTKDGRTVGLYIAYYRRQAQGRELVAWQNQIGGSPDRAWRKIGEAPAVLPWDGAPLDVRGTSLRGVNDEVAVRHWYWVADRWTASDHLAKVYLALSQLAGRGDDSAAVVLYTSAAGGVAAADEALRSFASAMSAPIRRTLEGARAR